ncbi:MAG: ABC transporter ATP-binding protein [Acidimicrobiales bacterium]|nr:MAG: ABC transporter ATP-binding protein [Acidimicrobiales bacterium]
MNSRPTELRPSLTAPPTQPPPPPTVVVDGVDKWFGDVVALAGVRFKIGPGVTALLGPNGAGKTTMLRILAGLTSPSRGSVRVLGLDPRRHRTRLVRRMGLVPQSDGLFEQLTPRAFLATVAALHGLPQASEAADESLRDVGIDPRDGRPLRALSKGNRQRVRIAQALVHAPEVLLLDEPLDGLDPTERRHMSEVIRDLGTRGTTVLVSSHVLDEVERLGSRVLVIARGRLAAEGDFKAIRALMDDRPHRIHLSVSDPKKYAAGLVGEGLVEAVRLSADGLVAETRDVFKFRRRLAPLALELDVKLREVRPLDEDLESVFMYLVGSSESSGG